MTIKLLVQDSNAPHVLADTLIAGPGITVVYGSGTITISGGGSSGGGFTWTNVTSSSNPVTLQAGFGYVASGGSSVHFKVPASASLGDSYKIIGNGNLWSIAQNAGQTITLGNKITTAGVGGSVQATIVSDCIEMVCIDSGSDFQINSSIGNLSIN